MELNSVKWLVCLMLAVSPACFDSHRGGGTSDTGSSDGAVPDGSRRDTSVRADSGGFDARVGSTDAGMMGESDAGGDGSSPPLTDAGGDAACGSLGGFRLCGAETSCMLDCPHLTECRERLQVCRPATRDSRGRGDGCEFDMDGVGAEGFGWTGNPCAVLDPAQDGTPEHPYSGVGMPSGYCAEAIDAGVPVRCVYGDGTFLHDGPPDASCPLTTPAMAAAGVNFCGGACDGMECPFSWDRGQRDHQCVGLSDNRGYGVCIFGAGRCDSANVTRRLDECEGWYGRPCVCMLPVPSPLEDFGFPVLAESCRRYRDDYPAHVRCVDRAWRPL